MTAIITREQEQTARAESGTYKWVLLGLLWVGLFLNQADRQIYNAIIPLIKPDLGLSNVQVGLVVQIFTLVYGALVPVAGFIGDFLSRKWIVLSSLIVFSAGTLMSGLSTGFISLVVFRSVATGGGEAFFYPAGVSLLAQFHEKTRAQALGILQTSLYVGITAGGLIAGYIGQHHGWRSAFLAFGGAGLLWAAVIGGCMRNTPHAAQGPQSAGPAGRIPLLQVLARLTRRPTVCLLMLASGSMVYVNQGYVTWTSTFLHEQFNLSLTKAGFYAMFWHNLFAFAGVLIGGRITDRLAPRQPSVRMTAVCLGLLLGAPFIFLIGRAPSAHACYAALSLFGLFRGIYDSNLFAALYDVVEPRLRASATGLMLSFAFIVGSSASTILGKLKDRIGLAAGLSSLGWFYLLGALFVLIAIRFFLRRDKIDQQSLTE